MNEEEGWPSAGAGYAECEALEEAVNCSICRDYFNTPLSLLCGHSFCSQCIRSNIQFQERSSGKAYCPQCREPTDSRQIHANHQLREIVKHFLLARPHLIAAVSAKTEPELRRRKRKAAEKSASEQRGQQGKEGQQRACAAGPSVDVIQLDSTSEQEEAVHVTDRQLRRRSTPVEYFPKDEQASDDSDEEEDQDGEADVIEDSGASSLEDDLEYESPLKKRKSSQQPPSKVKKQENTQKSGAKGGLPNNWAVCPVCSGSFPMAIFNDHLDKCLRSSGQTGHDFGDRQGKGKPALQVPPKLLLSLEKDKSLRDRLKKYGLSTKGSRQELEQRYSRFRVEVQSAMDRNEAGVSYESIAKRITGREVSEAQAGGKLPLLRASHAPQKTATGQGSEFEDLIKATRVRDAAISGRLDSRTSAPTAEGSKLEPGGILPPGEDAEVNSQPIANGSQGKGRCPPSSSIPAGGFRRPTRVHS